MTVSPSEQPAPSSGSRGRNGASRWGSVLIVDDDTATLGVLESILAPHCSVFSATSGEMALAMVDDRVPDCIVLAVQLPDVNGIDVCQALKANRTFADVPVVVITQYSDTETQARAYAAGAADFIQKPINEAIVRARVSNLLAMRRKSFEELRLSDARWRFALEGSEAGMWDWDTESSQMTCSPGLCSMIGLPPAEHHISRDTWVEWTHPDDRKRVESAYAALQTGKSRSHHLEYRLRSSEGATIWVSERGRVLGWGNMSPSRIMAVLTNTTARRSSEQRLVKLSNYDDITDLPNRSQCIQLLTEAIERAEVSTRATSLYRIDLSGLAKVNHSLGRESGDRLLREAASRLVELSSFGDQICRFGGKEFALIATNLEQKADGASLRKTARDLGARLIEELEKPYLLNSEQVFCSCTVGAALVPSTAKGNGVTAEDLIREAEVAITHAHVAGEGVAVFEPSMLVRLEERARLLQDLEGALFTDQFELAYQPIVDASGQVIGAEALARWNHPVRGAVSPLVFIPLAEESGLIVPLGSRLRKMACEQLVAWSQSPRTAQIKLSVNVSPAEFRAAGFVRDLLFLVEKMPVNPALLQLELTESLLLENFDRVLTSIRALEAVGITFALDDFGTGYSSLRYLKLLPFKRVKIDRSFVRDILHDPVDASLSSAIIGMAHNLGLEVVAEGVEEETQVRMLSEMGCARFQGYLYGRPGSAASVAERCDPDREGSTSPIRSIRLRSAPPSSGDLVDFDASILMVDDDVSTLQVLGRILSNYPKLRVAKTGKDALLLAQEQPPDLMILDAQMPDTTGFALWDLMRKLPALSEVPAIFITGFLDPEIELRAYALGAADFINKPLSAARVKVAVRNQLRIKRQTDSLRLQASLDPLTGIPNRRSFDVALKREVARTIETGSGISLVMVDVDHFKSINDQLGHPTGDRCLRQIAQLLQSELSRPIDLAARYGGEEFGVILPLSDEDHARHFAERIVRRIATASFRDCLEDERQVTISAGYASLEPAQLGVNAAQILLERADEALIQAKHFGRNQARGLKKDAILVASGEG